MSDTITNLVYNPSYEQNIRRVPVAKKERVPGLGEQILSRLTSKDPSELPINIKKMDAAGNVSFCIAMEDLVTDDERNELKATDSSHRKLGTFYVDAIGELLVRRNLEEFLSFMVGIKMSDLDRFSKNQHANFGIWMKSSKTIRFAFHVSLLHRIFVDMVGILSADSVN